MIGNEVIIKNDMDFTNDYTLISSETDEVMEDFFDANLIGKISVIKDLHLVSNGDDLLLNFGEKILSNQEMERLIAAAQLIAFEI